MSRLRMEEVLNLTAERQYAKGLRSFIWINGILLFGIPMFCVMTAFSWYGLNFQFHGAWLIVWLACSFALYCAVGCAAARWRWRSVERRALHSSQ